MKGEYLRKHSTHSGSRDLEEKPEWRPCASCGKDFLTDKRNLNRDNCEECLNRI